MLQGWSPTYCEPQNGKVVTGICYHGSFGDRKEFISQHVNIAQKNVTQREYKPSESRGAPRQVWQLHLLLKYSKKLAFIVRLSFFELFYVLNHSSRGNFRNLCWLSACLSTWRKLRLLQEMYHLLRVASRVEVKHWWFLRSLQFGESSSVAPSGFLNKDYDSCQLE